MAKSLAEIMAESRDISLWESSRASATYAKCSGVNACGLHSKMDCYEDYCVAYNSDLSLFPEVAVDEADIEACVEFADKSDYSKWSTRGASFIGKLKSDNIAGKVGEFVVRNTLRSMGFPTGDPDLKIYDVRHKSFDSDLKTVFNGVASSISVKTFRIHDGLPSRVSWVMALSEYDGKGGTDRHFFGNDNRLRLNEWFAGVALSPDKRHGRILALLPMQVLHDSDVFEKLEIRNGRFEVTKRAIYWGTLRDRALLPLDMGAPSA